MTTYTETDKRRAALNAEALTAVRKTKLALRHAKNGYDPHGFPTLAEVLAATEAATKIIEANMPADSAQADAARHAIYMLAKGAVFAAEAQFLSSVEGAQDCGAMEKTRAGLLNTFKT